MRLILFFITMAAFNEKIKIVSWNINNYKSSTIGNKLQEGEVIKLLSGYDIVCLNETHAKKSDELYLPGFKKPFRSDRPTSGRKSFGGIAIFIKNHIWKNSNISPVVTSCKDVVWLRFSGKSRGFSDLYLGSVYLSPERKKNREASIESLKLLRDDVTNFSQLGSIFLAGDFNARTSNVMDFIQGQDFCYEENSDEPYAPELCEKEKSYTLNIRNSEDGVSPSKRGKDIIQMCKDLDLIILNGRKPGDLFGKITCFRHNGCSVVDYAVCSDDIFEKINHFSVGAYMPAISDHCPIATTLPLYSFVKNISVKEELSNPTPTFFWENECELRFKQQMDSEKVAKSLDVIVENNFSDPYPLLQLKCILVDAAKASNVKLKRTNKYQNKKDIIDKIWFDKDCRQMKEQLTSYSAQLQTDPHNQRYRVALNEKRKEYKALLRHKKITHEKKCLENLEKAQPDKKHFWKLLGKMRKGTSEDGLQSIPVSNVISHFKNLLKSQQSRGGWGKMAIGVRWPPS